MTSAQTGGIFGLIEGAPKAVAGSPGYGLEFHVRDANNVYLAMLEGATDKQFIADLLGAGAGSFTILATDAKATATNLANENIVEVRWAGTTIGHWLIQRKRHTVVADTTDSELIQVSGQGALALLRKCVLYPLSWPAMTDPDSLETPLVCAPSAGGGILGMWSSNVDLPLTIGFTPLTDSEDVEWPQDVYIEFRAGQNLYDVIDALRGRGYDFLVSPTLTLSAYVSAGTTSNVAFRQGLNIVQCSIDYDTTDHATVVLGEGQGLMMEDTDFTWNTKRRQAALAVGNATNETQVANAVTAYLERVHEPLTAIELEVLQSANTTLPAFGVDYQLGDTVKVVVPGDIDTTYRVLSAELRELGDPRTVLVRLGLNQVHMDIIEQLRTAIDAGVPVAAGAAYNLVARDTRPTRNQITYDWLIAGTVSAGDQQGNVYEARERVRVLDVMGNVGTAPGSTATIDIEFSLDHGGTWASLFDSVKPTFPASNTRLVEGVITYNLFQPGTWFRLNVDNAGSTAIADLSVRMRAREI